MTEKPILFSGAMVRAILDGRKTQTRRVGKLQSPHHVELGVKYGRHATKGMEAVATYRAFPGKGTARWGICACPYGVPGDRLWVKETFQTGDFAMNEPRGFVYRATDPDWESTDGWKWKPSIFMPRSASRITLEITGVRVERLQDISEEDAKAEGLVAAVHEHGTYYGIEFPDVWEKDPRKTYKRLWESINGKGSWEKNSWCWCISFKRVTPCQTSPC